MTRKYWVDAMDRLASPVLEALAENRLAADLPKFPNPDRSSFAPLEAFSRTIVGIAPWLEAEVSDPDEKRLQRRYRELILLGLDHATNPAAQDYMNWGIGGDQPLVDAGFLSEALLRAPRALIDPLSDRVRSQLITALKQTRSIWHTNNNWLFFSGMVEALLSKLGEAVMEERIDFIIDTFEGWYLGDGVYSDGAELHVDYYNSLVIHPMYVDMCRHLADVSPRCQEIYPEVLRRAKRHAVILERLIAPDGTYPVVGRSVAYRTGVFHLLSQMAAEDELSGLIDPAQVRTALTAVIRRALDDSRNYNEDGFLVPGIVGMQAELAEGYINCGSLYLAAAIFLPLGLPDTHDFWTGADKDWTMKRLWAGEAVLIDGALA